MPFHVVIVTPEHQVLDETVSQAILPAHDGEIGILTDRARSSSSSAKAACNSTSKVAKNAFSTSKAASLR